MSVPGNQMQQQMLMQLLMQPQGGQQPMGAVGAGPGNAGVVPRQSGPTQAMSTGSDAMRRLMMAKMLMSQKQGQPPNPQAAAAPPVPLPNPLNQNQQASIP